MDLALLYRGPLESCNYGCNYCPFAKKVDGRADLAADRQALRRFREWVLGNTTRTLGVFFTPWGEALIRRWYQETMVELSHAPHVERVVAQTNLSGSLSWVARADPTKLALWATYHPEWTSRSRFVERVRRLRGQGIRLSVGTVGMHRLFDDIEALRREVPEDTYVWINAVKSDEREAYSSADVARLSRIDPLFTLNTERHASRGHSCRAGASVVSVDGDGTLRRCHFIREKIGNLYDPGIEEALRERPCTNDACGCHIGYVHLDRLELGEVFRDGLLERIPAGQVWKKRLPIANVGPQPAASAARISQP